MPDSTRSVGDNRLLATVISGPGGSRTRVLAGLVDSGRCLPGDTLQALAIYPNRHQEVFPQTDYLMPYTL